MATSLGVIRGFSQAVYVMIWGQGVFLEFPIWYASLMAQWRGYAALFLQMLHLWETRLSDCDQASLAHQQCLPVLAFRQASSIIPSLLNGHKAPVRRALAD